MSTVNYELEGTVEHKVQSDIEFRLIVTQNGAPCDSTAEVTGWLRGINENSRAKVTKSHGLVKLNFHVGTPGAYELEIEINKKKIFEPSIVKVVDQFAKHYEDFRFEISSEVFNGGHVGHENLINITARKNNQLHDIDLSVLFVRVGKPSELQVISPVQTGTGTYVAKFICHLPGFHPIDVWYQGKSCIARPERVHFISASDPKQTKAIQVPQNYQTVGQVVTFQIQSRNSNGVNNTSGGDNYEVQVEGPASLSDLVIRDTLDGKYAVSFTPLQTGTYAFDVTLNGVPIGNSPVKVTAIRK